ncbi:PilZ domain-containing protein [Myxococcota bacterium]
MENDAKPVRSGFLDRRERREMVRWVAQWVDTAGDVHMGQVCDVSESGMFLRPIAQGTDHVPVGAILKVLFAIPILGRHMVTASAIVRWKGASYSHGCSGFGLEFDNSSPDVSAFLASQS